MRRVGYGSQVCNRPSVRLSASITPFSNTKGAKVKYDDLPIENKAISKMYVGDCTQTFVPKLWRVLFMLNGTAPINHAYRQSSV